MDPAWLTLKEAGAAGVPLMVVGGAGLLLAVAAVVAYARYRHLASWVGAAALALGVACAVLGAGGMIQGRLRTEARITRLRPGPLREEAMRHAGYRDTRAAGKLGLLAAALPLLAGALAMFASRREDEANPFRAEPPRYTRASMVGAGALSFGLTVAGVYAPLPGRQLADDDPAWEVLAELDALQHDGDVSTCHTLEAVLDRHEAAPPRAIVPELPAVRQRCVEARVQRALTQWSFELVNKDLGDLAASSLTRSDPELLGMVTDTLGEVRTLAAQTDRQAALDREVAPRPK